MSIPDFESFLANSPSPFHMTMFVRKLLTSLKFIELFENRPFPDPVPPNCFIVRAELAVIAFSIGTYDSLVVLNAHNDYPHFRPRPASEFEREGQHYVILEHTGKRRPSPNSHTDAGLSLEGQVLIRRGCAIVRKLVDSGRPVAFLTRLRPLGRDETQANHFPALIGGLPFRSAVASLCDCAADDIVDWDLRFVPLSPAHVADGAFAASHLSVLSQCYCVLSSFVSRKPDTSGIKAMAIYGGQEDTTKTAFCAGSNFFTTILRSILQGDDYDRLRLKSLNVVVRHILSNKFDRQNSMKGGVALKTGASSASTADMIAEAVVTSIARNRNLKLPVVVNANSAPSPRGIAPKVREVTGIRTVEIGYQMAAQGTVREVVKWKDINATIKVLRAICDEYDEMKLVQA
jgi:aspartyl aminopeptidase